MRVVRRIEVLYPFVYDLYERSSRELVVAAHLRVHFPTKMFLGRLFIFVSEYHGND